MTETVGRTLIETALEDAGFDAEHSLRTSYSGRYMYGATCFGIIGTVTTFAKFLVALQIAGDDDGELVESLADNVRQDSMGHETIFYFPGYALAEDGEKPSSSEK